MEEAWSVPDVYLLTEGREGEVAVPHLTLTVLDSGLALDKADGEPVWDSAWGGLEEMSPVERSVLPDGRAGVVIVVVEQGREHRRRARPPQQVAPARGVTRADGGHRCGCAGSHHGAPALCGPRLSLLSAGSARPVRRL